MSQVNIYAHSLARLNAIAQSNHKALDEFFDLVCSRYADKLKMSEECKFYIALLDGDRNIVSSKDSKISAPSIMDALKVANSDYSAVTELVKSFIDTSRISFKSYLFLKLESDKLISNDFFSMKKEGSFVSYSISKDHEAGLNRLKAFSLEERVRTVDQLVLEAMAFARVCFAFKSIELGSVNTGIYSLVLVVDNGEEEKIIDFFEGF